MIDLYYNEDHSCYAVLVSKGYGAGWSTWNYKELAYDKRVVEWYLEHCSYEFCNRVNLFSSYSDGSASKEHMEAAKFFNSLGYMNVYFGGYRADMLQWVSVDAAWRIMEVDGFEKLEFRDESNWNYFGGSKK